MRNYRDSYTTVRNSVLGYLVRAGDALSQLINVVIFLSENPNESISGRSYRLQANWFWGKMMVLIDWIFSPIQDDHCKKAYCNDLERAKKLLGMA